MQTAANTKACLLKRGFQPYTHVTQRKERNVAGSGQWHGWDLSRDMACLKLERSISLAKLRGVVWTLRCLRFLRCVRKAGNRA